MDDTRFELDATLADERIRPFLPLVYLAWSDADLSPEELEGVCQEVARHNGVDIDCQVALRRWPDPNDPPTPGEVERLRSHVAAWVADLSLTPNATVTDLGEAIAASTRPGGTVTSDGRVALAGIQERFGPLGPAPSALGTPVRLRKVLIPKVLFSTENLSQILDGDHASIRNRMREVLHGRNSPIAMASTRTPTANRC
jgi:acyl-CoA oxidase